MGKSWQPWSCRRWTRTDKLWRLQRRWWRFLIGENSRDRYRILSGGCYMDLKDKVVVITGSAGGIGKVMALAMAQEGGKIVVADRRDQPFAALPGTINETVEEIEKAGGQALPVRLDLRREEEIVALRDQVLERFGTVD